MGRRANKVRRRHFRSVLFFVLCHACVSPLPSMRKFLAEADACAEYKRDGHTTSGTYTIGIVDGGSNFSAHCDMHTNNQTWIVFQRRMDGSVDFNRNWTDYGNGFGNLMGEFWLGLDKIARLTKAGYRYLRVDMMDWRGIEAYAEYSRFYVQDESRFYQMTASVYSGNAGDELNKGGGRGPAYGMRFSTMDADHDQWDRGNASGGNCANQWHGGWWFNNCMWAYPNGLYGNSCKNGWQFMTWPSFTCNSPKALKSIAMKIRKW